MTPVSSSESAAVDDEVFARQIELMNRNARSGFVGSALGIPLLGVALFGWSWPMSFLIWALASLGVILGAWLRIERLYSQGVAKSVQRRTGMPYVLSDLTVGVVWGTAMVVFFDAQPARLAVLLMALLANVVAAVGATAVFLPSLYAFVLPVSLAFVGRAGLDGAPLPALAAAAAVLVLTMLMLFAHRMNGVMVASIRMRFENRALNEALTEQRVQERTRVLEAASRHKSEFLANMSHELRTPLNAIIGYSEMLQEDAAGLGAAALVPDLKKIHSAGHHLLEMINSVLDLSKIEAGRMEVLLEDFELPALLTEIRTMVEPLARRNQNRLTVDCAEGLSRLRTDWTKLRQVLLNLLSNACKFTHDGEVHLGVVREFTDGRNWIAFRVSDTGIGITAEQIGRLFQDFAQADRGTARLYGGTGLGLALSRRLCRLMGGDIVVTSDSGQGSTFTARLPLDATAASPPALSAQPVRAEGTVLVIDDDAVVRDLLDRFLSKEGFRVLQASGGEQGLELARREQPDVITLDLMMAGMDGWSVLAAVSADPAVAGIPVVILSMLDDHTAGYALGASEYLTKPIDRERLLAALRRHRRERPVLVVDDDPMMRTLLRRLLEAEGHTVIDADGGHSALRRLVEQAPGMILLDLLMPGMDGFEFLATLRQDVRWHDIPVVIVTAKEMTADDRIRLNGSVVRVLHKCATGYDRLLADVRALVGTSVAADRRVPR